MITVTIVSRVQGVQGVQGVQDVQGGRGGEDIKTSHPSPRLDQVCTADEISNLVYVVRGSIGGECYYLVP